MIIFAAIADENAVPLFGNVWGGNVHGLTKAQPGGKRYFLLHNFN